MRYLTTILLVFITQAIWAAAPADSNGITHGEILRVSAGLLVVLIVIFILSWIVKRLNVTQFSSAKGFKSIATMVLGPKEKLMLMQVGTQFLLIGVSANSINLVHDFGNQLPEGFDSNHPTSFASIFKSAQRKP